jgi:hypothetical protein
MNINLSCFNYPENLSPELISNIEKKMRPGALSIDGFLDMDESLIVRRNNDRTLVLSLQTTERNIANRLNQIIKKAWSVINREGKYAPVSLEKKFEVTITTFGGHQECPFGCEESKVRLEAYYDVCIKNVVNNQAMKISGMMVHLIGEHGFFEGNVSYRTEPYALVSLLDIQPHQEYPLKTHIVQRIFRRERYARRSWPQQFYELWNSAKGQKEQLICGEVKAYYIEDKNKWYEPKFPDRTVAQIFICNITGEKLPKKATLFGHVYDEFFSISEDITVQVLDIRNIEEAQVDPEDHLIDI